MKILGIGNAIVDVICKVDDNFISQNNLTKSTMKLFFDEKEFKSLLTNLKIEKTVSGGSVANSIVGLSQLNNKAGFIGKISDDELTKLVQDQFDLRPGAIIKTFNLQNLPSIRGGCFYRDTAAYGHFGRTDILLPWEDVSQKAIELSRHS